MLKAGPDPTHNPLWLRLPLCLPFVFRDPSDAGEQRSGRNLSCLASVSSLTLKCAFWWLMDTYVSVCCSLIPHPQARKLRDHWFPLCWLRVERKW